MQIDKTLADAYLSGMPMDSYRDTWFFTASQIAGQVGENIFTPPSSGPEMIQKARTAAQGIEAGAWDFVPLNLPVWDALCPDWRQRLAEIQIDLIAGFPEPYDATVERGPDDRLHVIFDLCCWAKYIGKTDVPALVKNLLTHELFHVVTAQLHPELEKACVSPDYRTQLDAVTFNEGFAHLLSYQTQELDAVNWHSARLAAVEEHCRRRMADALQERDAAAQEKNLYEALCGNYYEKYACMCGMLYLARVWERSGISGLKSCFGAGWSGFAAKTIGADKA